MLDSFLQNLPLQVQQWIDSLGSPYLLRQAGALGVVLLLAPILAWVLRRLLNRVQSAVMQIPFTQKQSWPDSLFHLLGRALRPLSTWMLAVLAVPLFGSLGWESDILAWLAPLLLLWLVYRVGGTFLALRMDPERARRWTRQVLRPLVLITAALHSLTLLDDLMQVGFGLGENLQLTVGGLLLGLALFVLFLVISREVRKFLSNTLLPRAEVEPSLNQVISAFVTYALVLTGVFIGLGAAGINLTALTFIAAGLTVGLGFGLQEVISNFVSGFILLIERSISPGDVIQVGDSVGVVEVIGIRSTLVRTNDNVDLVVPNSQFLTDVATNFTRGDSRVRIHVTVGVSYDSDPRQVEEALLQAAGKAEVLKEPKPNVFFTDFGASSLDFDLMVWTDQAPKINKLSSDLRFLIWDELKEQGIEIPFPQRDIHIRTITGAAGPDVGLKGKPMSLSEEPSVE